MNCIACHRTLKDPISAARGLGPICLLKYKPEAEPVAEEELPKVKRVFQSWQGVRSWVVMSQPRHLVRVTPLDDDTSLYECEHGTCTDPMHVEAIKRAEEMIEAAYRAKYAPQVAA